MKNRIPKKRKKSKFENLRKFFLACEFKPNSDLFSVLDPFVYDISPAFIHGSLGIISYEPETYSIIDVDDASPPLFGYVMTITHPDTILLLDKIKGVYGPNAFNMHHRVAVKAFTDIDEEHDAWCYLLSDSVLENYERIEQIENGIFDDEDAELIEFLDKIGESLQ